ncbi:hypothetical protein DL93DRAFT_2226134 [Clavulina sp. PMI_390]|nr:hypothetical protein DL93DRAFT_2226134 [Clavulina sp. PMI_390]
MAEQEQEADSHARSSDPDSGKGDLFIHLRFYISESLRPDAAHLIRRVIEKNDGSILSRYELASSDYIITDSHTLERDALHEFGSDASKAQPHIVTPQWLWTAVWISKLPDPQYYSTDPRKIFSGVVACCEDIQLGDKEAIAAGIRALGGQFKYELTRDVTHLFVVSPSGPKYDAAMKYFESVHQPAVLTPLWFDDSCKLKRAQPLERYLFPNPQVLRPSVPNQPVDMNASKETDRAKRAEILNANLDKLLNGELKTPRLTRDKERVEDVRAVWASVPQAAGNGQVNSDVIPSSQSEGVWAGRRIVLADSLELAARAQSVHAQISVHHGVVVEEDFPSTDDYDVLITAHSEGTQYRQAHRAKKLIGTLAWLFYVMSTGRLTSPSDHILHAPFPSSSIAELKITITNYTGDAREYLKKLLAILGAEPSPSMGRDTYVVIAATLEGKKAETAEKWGIPIVNHLWLEECFQQWQYINPASETGRFVSFPRGVNYANILGAQGIGNVRRDPPTRHGRGESEAKPETLKPKPTAISQASHAASVAEVEGALGIGESDMPTDTAVNNGVASQMDSIVPDTDPVEMDTDVPNPQSDPMDIDDIDEDTASPSKVPAVSQPSTSSPTTPRHKKHGSHAREGLWDSPQKSEASNHSQATPRASIKRTVDLSSPARPSQLSAAASSPSRSTHSSPKKKRHAAAFIDLSDDDDDNGESFPSASQIWMSTQAIRQDKEAHPPLESQSQSTPDPGSEAEPDPSSPLSSPPPKGKEKEKARSRDEEMSQESEEESMPPAKRQRIQKKAVNSYDNESGPSQVVPHPEPVPPSKGASEKEQSKPAPLGRGGSRSSAGERASIRSTSSKNRSDYVPTEDDETGNDSALTRLEEDSEIENIWKPLANAMNKANADARKRLSDPNPSGSPSSKTVRAHASMNEASSSRHDGSSTTPASARTKRQAATKAAVNLAANVEDMNKFQADMLRSKGDPRKMSLVRQSDSPDRVALASSSKKGRPAKVKMEDTSDEESDSGESSDSADEKSTKRKPSAVPQPKKRKPKVLLTKAGVKPGEEDYEAFVKMVNLTDDPDDCAYVVTTEISRTEKFVRAMPHHPIYVDTSWITASVEAGELQDTEDHLLNDPEGEKHWKFKLADALERARSMPQRIFHGYTFHVTKSVKPDIEVIKRVAESAGGKAQAIKMPKERLFSNKPTSILLSCGEDRDEWIGLLKHGVKVYTVELILNSVLRQEIDWQGKAGQVLLT